MSSINDLFEEIDYQEIIQNELIKYKNRSGTQYRKIYKKYKHIIDKDIHFLLSHTSSYHEKIFCYINKINPVCDHCKIKKMFIREQNHIRYEKYCYNCVNRHNIKEFCINVLNTCDKKFPAKYLSTKIIKYPHIISILQEKVSHIKNKRSIVEMIYCLLNDIDSTPKCPECEKLVKFSIFEKGYNTYCSHKCQWHSEQRQQKAKNTIKLRYGVDNVSHCEEIQKKKIETNRQRLGVDWPSMSTENRIKSQITLKNTKEKIKKERQKFKNYLSLNEIKHFIIEYLNHESIQSLSRHIEFSIQLYNSLLHHTKNFNKYNPTIGERIYSIINNLNDRPICVECNNNVKYKGNQKYYTYCSVKCSANSNIIREKYIDTCIKKFGVTNTFQSEELMKNVPNQNTLSKISQELFWTIYNKLHQNLKNKCNFGELNKELYLYNKKKHKKYFIDFNLQNVCIEFNGTYWHADKRFFNKNDVIRETNAADIWSYDSIKQKFIRSLKYELLIINEYDYINDKKSIIDSCIDFINNNINKNHE